MVGNYGWLFPAQNHIFFLESWEGYILSKIPFDYFRCKKMSALRMMASNDDGGSALGGGGGGGGVGEYINTPPTLLIA